MTQKELSYMEDAIGHEDNIVKIISDMIEKIDDQNLITFLNNEQSKHSTIRENLVSKLRGKLNE